MRIAGVDPGIGGALAVLEIEIEYGEMRVMSLDAIPMPVVELVGMKNYVDGAGLRNFLLQQDYRIGHAFIELVNAMPSIPDAAGNRRSMGTSSAFQFGDAVGSVRTAIAICGIPFTRVSPRTWKAYHGLAGPDKEASRRRAIELLPQYAGLFARKLDSGRAEASLIALYGAAKLSGYIPEKPAAARRAHAGTDTDLFDT